MSSDVDVGAKEAHAEGESGVFGMDAVFPDSSTYVVELTLARAGRPISVEFAVPVSPAPINRAKLAVNGLLALMPLAVFGFVGLRTYRSEARRSASLRKTAARLVGASALVLAVTVAGLTGLN
jgi:hypothetical protein